MSYDPKTNTIWTFDGTDNDFLSNFHPVSVYYKRAEWPTAEHAYQGMKTVWAVDRKAIRMARSPGIAKRMGQSVEMRKDWDEVKRGIMLEIVRAKFTQSMLMKRMLLETRDAKLEEGNSWNDRIWGICPPRSGNGTNWLGLILMQVREELQHGK